MSLFVTSKLSFYATCKLNLYMMQARWLFAKVYTMTIYSAYEITKCPCRTLQQWMQGLHENVINLTTPAHPPPHPSVAYIKGILYGGWGPFGRIQSI